MANINKLTEKILEESKSKSKELLMQAEQEGTRILEKKIQEAKTLEEVIISKAKSEAASAKDRIISSAKMKIRNEKLEAKQRIIEKVFDMTLEKLSQMSVEQNIEFIKASIFQLDIPGEYNLILDEKGKSYISADFINEINLELMEEGKSLRLKLSDKIGNFNGGFLIEKDGIEINSSYEALTNSLKEELEYEITRILFT